MIRSCIRKVVLFVRPRRALLGGESLLLRPIAAFSTQNQNKQSSESAYHVHFRETSSPHPLHAKDRKQTLDISGLPHYIWTPEEINERMNSLYHHKPQTLSDKVMKTFLNVLYHSFNFVTGYKEDNPTPNAMKRRLIILESVAGVPGFVAAGFRHFRSIRTLNRDFGWIPTLLEEAENERMHLIICLEMFKPSWIVRVLVITGQYVMTPFLMTIYLIKPKAMHRFVGYLEEAACQTYVNAIKKIETPGTPLNEGWAPLKAPEIAIKYYRLYENARWVDVLKCIFADESNHRDVNHTFAEMPSDDPNPFVEKFQEKASVSWRLNESGKTAWDKVEAKEKI